MTDKPTDEAEFNRTTARLLRREELRRAAEDLNTTSGPGLERALSDISREVTEEAAARHAEAAKATRPEPLPGEPLTGPNH